MSHPACLQPAFLHCLAQAFMPLPEQAPAFGMGHLSLAQHPAGWEALAWSCLQDAMVPMAFAE